ncbi:MAG: polyprenyl synthetase family protein [Candidatus Moranbacteria bacterium]|nr:polyprenyl synthetase family protein [Candidatus Moranbacteria bacterium]
MGIEDELKVFKARLDKKIEAHFSSVIQETKKEDEFVASTLEYAKEMLLGGGKRLRAAFMYHGYLGAGGREEEKILLASMSIEYIHLFLLVHDDIIDRDDQRHGFETLHRYYANKGKYLFPKKDTEHFGNAMAIIVGDVLSALGNDIIFRSDFPLEKKFAALSKLQNIISYTVIGQTRDVYMEYLGKASEEEILAMYKNKTAKYTVEGPLHLGALLAGADEALLEKFSAYAIPLGIAFQIQDDILGIFGDEQRLGKPVGSDIKEGKITLLVTKALHRGSAVEQKRIREILSLGERLTRDDIVEFRGLIEKTGALDATKKLALEYIEKGKETLEGLRGTLKEPSWKFLSDIALYMCQRKY